MFQHKQQQQQNNGSNNNQMYDLSPLTTKFEQRNQSRQRSSSNDTQTPSFNMNFSGGLQTVIESKENYPSQSRPIPNNNKLSTHPVSHTPTSPFAQQVEIAYSNNKNTQPITIQQIHKHTQSNSNNTQHHQSIMNILHLKQLKY